MKTRIFALGLAVLLVFTMLAGCSGGNSGAGSDSSTGSSQPAPAQQEYPITVNDVEIKEAPTSVVTLSPSLADVMTALKYETLLTGRSEDCTAEDLASLPTVGTAKNLDMDKLKESAGAHGRSLVRKPGKGIKRRRHHGFGTDTRHHTGNL